MLNICVQLLTYLVTVLDTTTILVTIFFAGVSMFSPFLGRNELIINFFDLVLCSASYTVVHSYEEVQQIGRLQIVIGKSPSTQKRGFSVYFPLYFVSHGAWHTLLVESSTTSFSTSRVLPFEKILSTV